MLHLGCRIKTTGSMLANSKFPERATYESCLSYVPRLPERGSSSLDNSNFTMPSNNTNMLFSAPKTALLRIFRGQILRPDRLTNTILLN